MKLLIATNNKYKITEISPLLPKEIKLITLAEAGITENISETGKTLQDNAYIKANYAFQKTNLNCFADDTGLEVEALNGAPGVFSARYAGDENDSKKNVALLLKNLEGINNRRVCFKTVIALIINGEIYFFEGIVNGTIIEKETGTEGFGYDPVFVPKDTSLTFAQMSLEQKNKISHRSMATQKLIKFLESYHISLSAQ